ncbi:uncharacterized protein FFE2_01882 [Fusarium fujikuroi]|jgi:hypothetical protein
MLFL